MFPGESFPQYCSRIVSRPVSVVICSIFILKIIAGVALELRLFGEMISQLILPNTPVWVIVSTMLAVCTFVAWKGIENLARSSEILVWAVFLPLIIVVAIMAKEVDYTNLMPAFTTPLDTLAAGGCANVLSFTGIEICLLAAPYLVSTKSYRRRSVLSVLIIGISFIVVTAFVVLQFGYQQTAQQTFPVFDMMDTIVMPGSFIERQEALIISFYIISVFFVVSTGTIFSVDISKNMIRRKNSPLYYIIFFAAILLSSMIARDIPEVLQYRQILFRYLGWSYMLIVPIALLLIAKIRRVGGNVEKTVE
jgi:spore germination protein